MLKDIFQNRADRLQKLIGLNAPPIILENEVNLLTEASRKYFHSVREQEQDSQTNGDVFEVDSDDEHYAFLDYCIRSQGMSQVNRISIEDWRKLEN